MESQAQVDLFLRWKGKLFRTEIDPLVWGTGLPAFKLIAGYTLRKAVPPTEAPRGRAIRCLRSLVALGTEFLALYRQIGLTQLLRYVYYRRLPRPLSVDAVRVMSIESSRESVFVCSSGIVLKSHYTSAEIHNGLFDEQLLSAADVLNEWAGHDLHMQAAVLPVGAIRRQRGAVKCRQPQWMVAGAGTYTASVLIPAIRKTGGGVVAICSNTVVTCNNLAKAFDIPNTYGDYQAMLDAHGADNILIATPNYLHPLHIRAALEKNLRVYCEKPVAIDQAGVAVLEPVAHSARCMVGFNRRFAPAIQALRRHPAYQRCGSALLLHYLVNFGSAIPPGTADRRSGGGVLHMACCHYLDLIEYLGGAKVVAVQVMSAVCESRMQNSTALSFVVNLQLENRAVGTLSFSTRGDRAWDVKERLIVVGDHLNAVIHDFSTLNINGQTQRFFHDHYGVCEAFRHLREGAASRRGETPLLRDAVRNVNVLLQIERMLAEPSGGSARSTCFGRTS
ncbi:MAG: Gfo/Idh/MocA family oxidoreductase [Deltaproteobacteria bacterium]|nr:Gfo/Idh/MocA family oxidoreductase [Deltaproteobacteria bacterium]